MERPGRSIPDAAETAPVRDPLLHPRSRRIHHRSGPDHGPRRGLVARSLAIEYARRRVRVNAETTGEVTSTVASPRSPSLDPRDTEEASVMTTAIIGAGGIGSVIARLLASGGETLRLSSADKESARTLAAEIGRAAGAADNRDALQGADAVVLALRFTVLKGVIDEIADSLTDKLVVVPSNPLTTDAHGNVSRLLPEGQSSGEVVTGWLPAGALGHGVWNPAGRSLGVRWQPVTGAGGPVLCDRRRPCRRGSRAVDPDGRLRAGEGRRARGVGPAGGGRRPSRSRSRPRTGAVIDRWGLMLRHPG